MTSFFRDPDGFAALERQVVEPLIARHAERAEHAAGDVIRVWAPGCATGEEVYSIAILLLEGFERRELTPQFEIFASDIDERALAVGRGGRYPKAIGADLSAARLARFFVPRGDRYLVKPDLRARLLFASHDLLRDPPFHQIDLISCCNLLIYLEAGLQRHVFDVLHYALKPDGTLFLGAAEAGDPELFRPLDRDHGIYQKREGPPTLKMEPRLPSVSLGPASGRRQRPVVEAHRVALETAAPPSILVDADFRILHLSETAGRFLQPSGGPFSSNLTDLVRPELAGGLRSALLRVFRSGAPITTLGVALRLAGESRRVSLHLLPRWREGSDERLALVVFLESEEVEAGAGAPETPRPGAEQDVVIRLREELRESQEQLLATREDYELANEELRASNEELQSINEEVHTVNNELKHKLAEVSSAHNDLENLISTTEIGTLFLDLELRIQRFTPKLAEIFAVTIDDRGRPIGDFTHSLQYHELLPDCRRVLQELTPIEREVASDDGRWYALRLRPDRTLDDRIDGLVLTLFEITDRKRAEQALLEREAQLELAHQAAQVAWWSIDLQQGTITWSESSRRLLGVAEGEEPAELGDLASRLIAPDDRAAFLRAFSEPGRADSELEVQFRVESPERGERWLVSRGRLYPALGDGCLLAVLIDVSEQKAIQRRLEVLDRVHGEQEAHAGLERSTSFEQLRSRVSRVTQAEQEERRQLASVLHDDLQQQLYGIRLRITELLRSAETPAAGTERLTEIYDQLAEAVATTRRLAARLTLPSREADLQEVLDSLAQQMESLHDLTVEVRHQGAEPIADESLRVVVHQVVRELLFNVVKHSGVKHASVTTALEGQDLVITIEDRGRGFDPESVRRGSGLETIRRRLELVGGALEIASQPGFGVRVVVRAPVAAGSG